MEAEQAIANQTLQTELTSCRQTTEALCSQLELWNYPQYSKCPCGCSTPEGTSSAVTEPLSRQLTVHSMKWEINSSGICHTGWKRIGQGSLWEDQHDGDAHEHNWITKDSSQSIAWDYTPCLDSDGSQVRDWHGKDITSKAQAEFAQERQPNWKHKIASLGSTRSHLEATPPAVNTLLTTDNFDQAV